MRIVDLINEHDMIERILRHLGLWEPSVRPVPARDHPSEVFIPANSDLWLDEDPFTNYEREPVIMGA